MSKDVIRSLVCLWFGGNQKTEKKKSIPIWNPPRDVCLLLRQHHQNPYLLLKPLHNGNKYGAEPIAPSTKLKEGYQNKFLVLEKLKYHASKSIIYEYIIIWISFLQILALTVRNKKSDFIRT
jgi:hypothetical protein